MTLSGGQAAVRRARAALSAASHPAHRSGPRPFSSPRCQNGGCPAHDVTLQRIDGLRDPKYLCDPCIHSLSAYYVIQGVAS